MNNKKPIYLMAGGRRSGSRSFAPIIQAIFKETGQETPSIAYVGAASDDSKIFYKFISSTIKNAGQCRIVHAITSGRKADIEKAKDILQSADAIFISGGDVEAGMNVLKKNNLVGFLQGLNNEGKLFFGLSAGSIMLAEEWIRWRNPDDDATAELFPCLGLARVICDTHGEDDDWEELKAALLLKQEGVTGFGITTDTCLKITPDGRLEALGGAIYRYTTAQGKINRLTDLMPSNPT
jgi:peptidase E